MSSFLESIETGGFAIIEHLVASPEIDDLASALTMTTLARSRAGIRHAMKDPAVSTIAHDVRLRDLAAAVLGASAVPYRATLFDKNPEANWLVVWHQDTALPQQRRHEKPGWGPWSVKEGVLYAHAPAQALSQILALRLHLDDSTERNGPLRVFPGTHVRGVLTDHAIEDLSNSTAPFECKVKRGGVLAMRPLLVHASSKSQAEEPRRVLHIEYAAAPDLDGLTLAVA